MLEIENTLLTGTLQVDSDTDGNVIIMQNRQEIKITPSQAKELESYLVSLSNTIKFVKENNEISGDVRLQEYSCKISPLVFLDFYPIEFDDYILEL